MWGRLGVFGSIWQHLEASGSIWQRLGASEGIWEHLVASGSKSSNYRWEVLQFVEIRRKR